MPILASTVVYVGHLYLVTVLILGFLDCFNNALERHTFAIETSRFVSALGKSSQVWIE